MAYRSNIYIKVEKKHKLDLLQTLHDTDLLDYIHQASEDDSYFSCEMPGLKWYESYPDVDKVNTYIDSLEDEAGLVAVGEDYDVQTWGLPYEVDLEHYVVIDNINLNINKTKSEEIQNFEAYKQANPELFI